ncbi:MAG: FecR family protein [Chitinophagaceae bacterium]|nr:MAG: FecR family protein [Chitinophagaceae bacterium]
MDTNLITNIIKKFLEGKCNDEEFAYLLHWYESFDDKQVTELNDQDKELLRRKILERIRQNILELQKEHHATFKNKVAKIRRITYAWKYIAAAIAVTLVLWGGIHFYRENRKAEIENKNELSAANEIIINNKSDRMHFALLPDSSKVWLGPNSSIEYPERFIDPERKVNISGEAFFKIYQEAKHPFIVTSGKTITCVLGTSFLIKTYKNNSIEVAVITGKVAVYQKDNANTRVTVTAGQKAVLDPVTNKIEKTRADNRLVSRWQAVNLSFNNVSFSSVAKVLDQKFNIHIHCTDSGMLKYRLNADFNDQNLTDILEMLEQSLNTHYEMANDSLINFYPNYNPSN